MPLTERFAAFSFNSARWGWVSHSRRFAVLTVTRNINAFGVYQDYYTRYSLSSRTPSDIRYLNIFMLFFRTLILCGSSWIGSFQLCMQYAPGILVGRAFDAGYL
jgi:hypothetical protein